MNRTLLLFIAALVLIGWLGESVSAQPSWYYRGRIGFDHGGADTLVRPLLCATDAAGNLWVISSNNIDAKAHNALWKKAPADSVMRLIEDYSLLPDPNVNSTRGIGTIGNDVFVSQNKGTTATASVMYVYRGGDPAKKEMYGSGYGHSGYGTSLFGVSITRDTIVTVGIAFNTTTRMYNYNRSYNNSPSAFASYIPPAGYAQEPGGPHFNGVDIIRDVATIPNANYKLTTTVFYTSRNSSVDHPSSGGIALWIGGRDTTPVYYRTKRVADFFSDLTLDKSIPYGITCDAAGNLYVAGVDTNRRWVKGYTIDTMGVATLYVEFPSQTDPFNKNPQGAPFDAPCDVAFGPGETVAYVIDEMNRAVYWFATTPTGVDQPQGGLPVSFSVSQNYPNPFNPATTIKFELPRATRVTLTVHDALGRTVATLADREFRAGIHYVPFDAGEYRLTSGVYYYRLTAGSDAVTKAMVLLK